METVLAIDAGTLSVRAGLFDRDGQLICVASSPIELIKADDGWAEYRFSDIWNATTKAIREIVSLNPAAVAGLRGIAIDATSSLYLQVQNSDAESQEPDVICWMDHRAECVINDIQATGHRYLDFVGGSMSPELYLPKILWLKRFRPDTYKRLKSVRDLSDAIAYRMTGVDRHSICGFACKLPYLADDENPWQTDLLEHLGLEDFLTIGRLSEPAGRVGDRYAGVDERAASELGISAGIAVAYGLIDAEAGALGVMGKDFFSATDRRLMLIGGTSTNYMAFSKEKRLVPGIWGPFKDAIFSDYWMHEGGQSYSGAALDAVFVQHPASPGPPTPENHAKAAHEILQFSASGETDFAKTRHIVPDWLGNRSPRGDGHARALVAGLGLETSHVSFLEHYYATARSLVLQSRHVITHFNQYGFAISEASLSGGQIKNPLMLKLYRDALGVDTLIPNVREPVLLGTAMVAATAAKFFSHLEEAVAHMSPDLVRQKPDPHSRRAYERAFEIYLLLFEARNQIEEKARAQ